MIARLVVQTVVWLAVMGAFLFVPAGTIAWPQAWLFLLEMGVPGLAIGIWLLRHDPALLAQRMALPVQREQPLWDRVLVSGLLVFILGWLVLMALDEARWHLSQVPVWAQILGAIGILASMFVGWLVFRANSYAAPVVKIQKERGHHIVTTGPYRFVRHPMYAGAIFFALGTPLLLGSWCGLLLSPALIIVFGVRAAFEERALAAQFSDYAQYAARVRYRLIPFVW
jgi:protein-S-isoprenylcysteine O-methyltransferase Ste14